MTQIDDIAFSIAVNEVHTILSGGKPSYHDVDEFGWYKELIEILRLEYKSGVPNAPQLAWEQMKYLYSSIDIVLQQGLSLNPDRDLLSFSQILEYLTREQQYTDIKQLFLNIVRDAAQFDKTILLQLSEIAHRQYNIPSTWIKQWQDAIREEKAKTPASSSPPSANGAISGGVVGQPQTSQPPQPSNTQYVPVVLNSFNLTDLGNSKRIVDQHGNDMHYIHLWGRWLIWDGTRWSNDDTGAVIRLAKQSVMNIYQEAAQTLNDDRRNALAKWAHTSEGRDKILAMVDLARSEGGIPIDHEQLDSDHYMLNVINGTVDLTTGALRKHKRSDMITKRANVRYDDKADCPMWISFLDTIMGRSQAKVDYLKRAVGYTLTGDVSTQVMFFCHGTGRNGKSTFLETLMYLLGDYAIKSPTEMVMVKHNTSGIPNDVAKLVGKRLSVTPEVEAGQRLSESKVKDLTGKDTITARFMRGEWFNFLPTHKLWMYGNYKPVIRGADDGIWRRIQLVPFTVAIPEHQRLTQMKEILMSEVSGILNWAIKGYLEYQQIGLSTPDEITDAISAYRSDMDTLGEYISDNLIIEEKAKTAIADIYADYVKWCLDNSEMPLDMRPLGQRLTERGFTRTRLTGGPKGLLGLRLRHSNKP